MPILSAPGSMARLRAPGARTPPIATQAAREPAGPCGKPDHGAFLTPSLSILLDLIRFAAAFLVLLGHAVQLRIWGGSFPFGTAMQHYCVVVFFVLSGLVIATSVLDPRKTLSDFAISRLARIAPVALPAIAFALLCAYLLSGPHPVPFDNSPDTVSPALRQVVLPMVFLSARPEFAGPVWDPPYWSLSYEAWYYALFALGWYLRGVWRWIALALAAALAGPMVLLLAPVWLAGVTLVHFQPARRVPLWLAPPVLVACVLAAAYVLAMDGPWKIALRHWLGRYPSWSEWALSDMAMALLVATGFAALRPIATRGAWLLRHLETPARTLAGFSFTLYLFHWPMLEMLRSWGLARFRQPAAFAGVLLGICVLAWAISRLTEAQSPALRRQLHRWLTPRAAPQPRWNTPTMR